MIYSYEINSLPLQTGDLICTTDGGRPIIAGEFWRLVGKLVPGEVDHVAIYVGPEGRCVESAVVGVYVFEMPGSIWDAEAMHKQRLFLDQFYGIAYPLHGKGLSPKEETKIREDVATYCLTQAALQKPYNVNYLNSQTEDAFYCSQLAYKAYLRHGIDLNTGLSIPKLKGTESIIYPHLTSWPPIP
jgi:uncharacterized protein YycO